MATLPPAGVTLIAENANVYFGDMKAATNATNAFSDSTESAGGHVSRASEIMTGALRRLGEIALDTFLAAGKAAIGFASDSINVAGDFEAGMNRFRAAAGQSVNAQGFQEFRQLFIDLGKELPVSTKEVEDAATEMVTGGIDPAIVAAGGLRETIQFAAAAQLSLSEAAETSAKILAGWTDPAASAAAKTEALTAAADDLTRAAAASSTTVAQLRLGLFNVQGAAQELHVPFQDTVATLADLAPAFESSAQAGTAFNVFLTRLVPATNPATDAMKELGIITAKGQNLFFDAQGTFLGMANAAQVLKEHLGGLSDQQKIDYLHTLFGNDAQKVANLLMGQGAAGIEDMKTKMAAANGVQAQAAIMQQGYNVALDNFHGSIEALQISAGTTLLPLLTNLLNNILAPGVNTITNFVDALSKGVSPSQALHDAIAPIVSSINAILPGFAAFAHLLETGEASTAGWARIASLFASLFGENIGKSITEVVRNVNGFVGSVQGAITTLEPVFGTLTVLFRDGETSAAGWARMGNVLQRVFGAELGGAIQDTIGTIAEIVNSFRDGGSSAQELGKVLEDVGHIWDEYSKTVISNAQVVWGVVQSVFGVVQTFLKNNGTEIQAFFKESWGSIYTIITTALELIRGIVMGVFLVIRDFLNAHSTDIQNILKNAWVIVSNIIGGALDIIKGILTAALKIFQGDWQGAWEAIRAMSESVVLRIWEVIKSALDLIANFFGTTLSDIGKLWERNFENYWRMTVDMGKRLYSAGSALIENLWDGVKKKWEEFKSWLEEQWQSIRDMLPGSEPADTSSPLYRLSDAGSAIITNLLDGLRDALPGLMDYVDGITDDIRQQFEDVADAITDTIVEIEQAQSRGYRTQASNLERLARYSDTSEIEQDIADTEDKRYALLLKLNEELAKGADANQEIVEQYKEQIALLEDRKTALAKTEKGQETVADNLEYRLGTAFEEAQKQFTDPRDIMAYYDLLSNQAFESADLQQQYYDAAAKGDAEQMVRLSQQMNLIDQAQELDRQAFIEQANKEDELTQLQQEISALQDLTSVTGDMVEQVQAFFDSLSELLAVASGDSNGYARGGSVQGGRAITVGEQGRELFVPQTDGWILPNNQTDSLMNARDRVSPAASAGQIMAGSTTNYTYGGPTYNLGVTTSQSPAVVQQSYAIMQALAR